jgi:hypothetical protein
MNRSVGTTLSDKSLILVMGKRVDSHWLRLKRIETGQLHIEQIFEFFEK